MTPINVDPYEIVVEHTVQPSPPLWVLVAAGLAWLGLSALVAVLTYRSSPKQRVTHATVVPIAGTRPRSTALRAQR
jgi:hypothetical protein